MIFKKYIILLSAIIFAPIIILSQQPDLILHNANVITMIDSFPAAQAIAIERNQILAVGSNEDILSLKISGTTLINLEGRTIVPGLIDAHSHCLLEDFRSGGIEGLEQAAQRVAADGYTTVHELYGNEEGFIPALQTLSQQGRLAVRVNVFPQYNTNCGDNNVPWMVYPYTQKKDTTLRIAGVKVFADGGSCFCEAITTPFQASLDECGTYGHLFKTQQEMNTIVSEVLEAGYPISMHAIGDSAIGVGLNAFQNAFNGNGNLLRCRMEHMRVMRPDLAEQMASLGIAASIQYTWALAERAWVWETHYIPEILDWTYAWRKMADYGIAIVGGNDCPYYLHFTQAMQTISLLATRKMDTEEILPTWMEGNALTVEEGLKAMAVTNAWVAFEEDVKGSIAAGKLADLTVLSDNPLAVEPFNVRDITIDLTIMDGVIRHGEIATHIVSEENIATPEEIVLYPNYPNPFNPETKLRFYVPDNNAANKVSLHIYNISGQLIRTMLNGPVSSGVREVIWNAQNESGAKLPSGIYLLELRTQNFRQVQKMILLK